MKNKRSLLWPLIIENSKPLRTVLGLLFMLILTVVPAGASNAQGIVDEEEVPSGFLFAGYSDKWGANETFIIKTQQQLERIIEEMAASDYVPFFHDLPPVPGERIDFLPVVDFTQETVIAVVGKRHDSPCRGTKVAGVTRDLLNELTINLEETFPESCGIDKLAAQANPVILIKVTGAVAGLKGLRESVNGSVGR